MTAATTRGPGILWRQPELLGLLLVTWVFNLVFGPVEVAPPLFVSGDLDSGAGLLGSYSAAFGIGAVIGALALGAARRLPLWPAMLGIIAGHGVGMLPFAFTLVQDRVPAGSLTTVLAARGAVLLTASPTGAALGGLLLDRTSTPTILVGCGVLTIAIVPAGAVALRLSGTGAPSRVTVPRNACE